MLFSPVYASHHPRRAPYPGGLRPCLPAVAGHRLAGRSLPPVPTWSGTGRNGDILGCGYQDVTSSESRVPRSLTSCKHTAPITPLESALIQVLIPKNLKPPRINTYKKHGGEGVLLLTWRSTRLLILSDRREPKDLSSYPKKIAVLPAPTSSGRSNATKALSSLSNGNVYPERPSGERALSASLRLYLITSSL